ncbi:MAG: class I SAM-dependent methyltransferase, partial [Candidatus Kapaibacterium sp.]
GCGNGDLLFKLSDKISQGIGIDNSQKQIELARKTKEKTGISNLEFDINDIMAVTLSESTDYTIISLLLHLLPVDVSVKILKEALVTSKNIIICDFCKPENIKQNLLLNIDQLFSGHYSNFRNFVSNGYTEGLLRKLEGIEIKQHKTFDPVIKIYEIRSIK